MANQSIAHDVPHAINTYSLSWRGTAGVQAGSSTEKMVKKKVVHGSHRGKYNEDNM